MPAEGYTGSNRERGRGWGWLGAPHPESAIIVEEGTYRIESQAGQEKHFALPD